MPALWDCHRLFLKVARRSEVFVKTVVGPTTEDWELVRACETVAAVDTGVPLLFNALYEKGALKSRLVVKAAGCGNPMGKNEVFKIGERNYTVLKKLLWKNNILLEAEDVGGSISRTLHFDVSTGQVLLSSNGTKKAL